MERLNKKLLEMASVDTWIYTSLYSLLVGGWRTCRLENKLYFKELKNPHSKFTSKVYFFADGMISVL
jgi:hypothetical protein